MYSITRSLCRLSVFGNLTCYDLEVTLCLLCELVKSFGHVFGPNGDFTGWFWTFVHSVRFIIHLSMTSRTAGRLSGTSTLVSQPETSDPPTQNHCPEPLHSPSTSSITQGVPANLYTKNRMKRTQIGQFILSASYCDPSSSPAALHPQPAGVCVCPVHPPPLTPPEWLTFPSNQLVTQKSVTQFVCLSPPPLYGV